MKENEILAIGADGGQRLAIAGGSYRIVVSGAQTNGEFAVIEMTVPPTAGPVPHAHEHINESFYVLEGEVTFYSKNGAVLAPKGAFVNIPKGGEVHNFKNNSAAPAKLLCTVMPAGLDDCFVDTADFMAQNPNITDAERKAALGRFAEKYGMRLYAPDYFQK